MKRRYRIDKSVLAIGTRPKIVDPAYRDSYRHRTCQASRNGVDLCGNPSIGAHVRTGECAGAGTKPSDDLTEALCDECHRDQESSPGPEWWIENVYKPQLRRRYKLWKQRGSTDEYL